MQSVLITKADGSKEPFEVEKLERSLRRSGAKTDTIAKITKKVITDLKEGMTTKEIYRKAFSLLKQHEPPGPASRYSLRRAVIELGPTGFPFEDFLSEILTIKGYTTKVRTVVKGACATHELDLIAHNDEHCVGIEAKFHNRYGTKTDIRVALYVYARFLDLTDRKKAQGAVCDIDEGWLVTNTKFTFNASKYGKCSGLKLISWNEPEQGNLFHLIEESAVHPVTCLTSLSGREKKELMNRNIVLCRTLNSRPKTLDEVGVKSSKQDHVLEEIKALCGKVRSVQ